MNRLAQAMLALVATVFVALSFFVWPSSDDFGFANSYRTQSLVTCTKATNDGVIAVDFPCHRYYSFDHPLRHATLLDLAANEYLTFVGRYFTNLLAFAIQGELALHWGTLEVFELYPALPVSMLLLFFLSARVFARQWGYEPEIVSRWGLFWGALGFVVLFLQHMPHLASSFYQVSQLLMHQTCNALSLLWLALLMVHHRLPAGGYRKTAGVLIMLLIVAIMGASEIILFWNGMFAFMIMAVATWKRHPRRRFHQFMFLLAALGGAAVVLAPGTLSRIGETASPSVPLWIPLAHSLSWSLRYLFSWVLSPTLWVMTLFLLPYAIQVVQRQFWCRNLRHYHWIAFVLLWVGMIWISWLLLAGIGREMPMRVVNGIYFYFLLGWFIGVHLIIAAFRISSAPAWISRRVGNVFLPLLLCVSFLFPGSGFLRPPNNFLQAISDFNGPLWHYRQQQLQRLDQIRVALAAGSPEVVVAPFQDKPGSVFYEDILPGQPNNWRNRFMGSFYGLRTVHLDASGK
ncbi:MAG: hypothetical protein HQL83_00770 [Magnetococcales bacterium]|nr:hypothetical protein [Magnetococcales bacterium]